MKQQIKDAFKNRPKLSGDSKLPKLKKLPKLPSFRKGKSDNRLNQAIENLPRITNETVAEHREEMLSSARKFIYPLQHSRQRIVKVSIALFIFGLALFIVFTLVSLYKFQSSSTFMYGVTRVLPLPVAKAGGNWISYESYLFELRHLTHYYETQQEVDFATENGKTQLEAFKKRAMQQVIDDAYVKQLANDNDVSVANQEIDDAVTLLRDQNRLGNSDEEFADVLKEFWGWSVDDFRRELRQQLLAQKVVAKLDTANADRARQAEARLTSGEDFAKVAAEASDDQATKANGGEYSFTVDRSNRDLAPKVIDAVFKLQAGQTSGIIDTGYTLEIVKVLDTTDGNLRVAHMSFNYRNVNDFIKPLADDTPASRYIEV